MFKVILGLFVALVSSSAFAQAVMEYKATNAIYTSVSSGWHRSKAAAAAELMGLMDAHTASSRVDCIQNEQAGSFIYNHHITGYDTSSNPSQFKRSKDSSSIATCAVSTSLQGGYAIGYSTREASCPIGYFYNATLFSGWTTAPGSGNYLNVPELPTTYCDGSCTAEVQDVVSCQSSETASPNGYYETSCTYQYRTTGGLCSVPTNVDPTPEPAPASPPDPTPDPTDPGGTGTGGGDGGGDPSNPEGTGTGTPTPDPTDPDGTTTGGGSGGSGGGTTGPTEPTPDPAPCGGVGEPKCGVKVDESGTPTDASNIFEQGNSDINSNKTAVQGAVDGIKNAQPLPPWSWTFQLPTGCSPYPLTGYGLTIDVCQFQPIIHDLMSMLWAAAGIFGLLALARSAFSGA